MHIKTFSRCLCAGLFLALSTPIAFANTKSFTYGSQKLNMIPQDEYSKCLINTAYKYNLDPYLILAIKRVESSNRWDKNVFNKNKNGTRDIGIMQTNTIHLKTLKRFNITEADLYEPCVSMEVAGWMLAKLIKDHGVIEGIGRYHSKTPRFKDPYIDKVLKQWKTLLTSAGLYQAR